MSPRDHVLWRVCLRARARAWDGGEGQEPTLRGRQPSLERWVTGAGDLGVPCVGPLQGLPSCSHLECSWRPRPFLSSPHFSMALASPLNSGSWAPEGCRLLPAYGKAAWLAALS